MSRQPEPLRRVEARKYTRSARIYARVKGSQGRGQLYEGQNLIADCPNCPQFPPLQVPSKRSAGREQ